MKMKINECIMTNSGVYLYAGRTEKHYGIVVHSTGANNPQVCRLVQPSPDDPRYDEIIKELGWNIFGNDWNHPDCNDGVNAVIGKNAKGEVSIWQCLPWCNIANGVWRGKMFRKGSPCYAEPQRRTIVCYTEEDNMLPYSVYCQMAYYETPVEGEEKPLKGIAKWEYKGRSVWIDTFGLRSYNNDPPYLQFEMCEDNLKNESYFNEVMDAAQELCAYLCKQFDIPLDNVVSHKESFGLGYGSEHGDPDHWLEKFGKDMNWFRKKVENKMGKVTVFKRGDKVKLLSNKAIDGTKIWDVVLDGRPLWVVDSDEISTAVTINEDLSGITARMHTYDVAYYDEQPKPEPEPTPVPNPSFNTERLRTIANLLRNIATEVDNLADGK
jgi:hypothetical protein